MSHLLTKDTSIYTHSGSPGFVGQRAHTDIISVYDSVAMAALNSVFIIPDSGFTPFFEIQLRFQSTGLLAQVFGRYIGSGNIAIRYAEVPDIIAVDPYTTTDLYTGWNSIARSIDFVGGLGFAGLPVRFSAKFNIPDAVRGVINGVSIGANIDDFSVPNAFYMANGVLGIIAGGSLVMTSIAHSDGDELKIACTGGSTMDFSVAGTIVYSSLVIPSPPLYMHALMYSGGDTVNNPVLANGAASAISFVGLKVYGGDTASQHGAGDVSFTPMLVSGGVTPAFHGDGSVAFLPLAVRGGVPYADGSTSFLPMTARGASTGASPEPSTVDVLLSFSPMKVTGGVPPGFHGSGGVTFRPLAVKGAGGGADIADGDISFLPMLVGGYSYSDSPDRGWMPSNLFATPSMLSNQIVAVVMNSTMNFANVFVASSSLAASMISALLMSDVYGFGGTIVTALMNSVIDIGAVTPTFDNPGNVWVLNDTSGATSTYIDYPFNSYARIGDSYYGALSDGLYKLGGTTDDGDDIRASMSLGQLDFGTKISKRVTDVYVGLSSTGLLVLRVTANGQTFNYVQKRDAADQRVQRFVLGKGLQGNFLSFELFNSDNTDFDISSIEFAAVPLTRRI